MSVRNRSGYNALFRHAAQHQGPLPVYVWGLIAMGVVAMFAFIYCSINADVEMDPSSSLDNPSTYSSILNRLSKNYSVADNTAIVIPSFREHRGFLERFLANMRAYCSDCHKAQFVFVISEPELADFKFLNETYSDWNPEIVTLSQIVPGWNGTEGQAFAKLNKYTFQSLKKLYGCLHAKRDLCWLMDSESMFIRNTTIEHMVGNFVKDPYMLINSRIRSEDPATLTGMKALGYRGRWGWLLESYLWVWNRHTLVQMERVLRKRFPAVWEIPVGMFIEIVYNMFVIHELPKYGAYRLLDSSDVLGDIRGYVESKLNGWGSIEDMRHAFREANPDQLATFKSIYHQYQFSTFKASWDPSANEISFLRNSSSVKLLLSEQSPRLYDMAARREFDVK